MANNKTTISGSIMRSGQRSNAPGVEKIVSEVTTLDDAITSLFTDDSGLGGVYGTLNKVMDLVNDTSADLSKEDKRVANIVKQLRKAPDQVLQALEEVRNQAKSIAENNDYIRGAANDFIVRVGEEMELVVKEFDPKLIGRAASGLARKATNKGSMREAYRKLLAQYKEQGKITEAQLDEVLKEIDALDIMDDDMVNAPTEGITKINELIVKKINQFNSKSKSSRSKKGSSKKGSKPYTGAARKVEKGNVSGAITKAQSFAQRDSSKKISGAGDTGSFLEEVKKISAEAKAALTGAYLAKRSGAGEGTATAEVVSGSMSLEKQLEKTVSLFRANGFDVALEYDANTNTIKVTPYHMEDVRSGRTKIENLPSISVEMEKDFVVGDKVNAYYGYEDVNGGLSIMTMMEAQVYNLNKELERMANKGELRRASTEEIDKAMRHAKNSAISTRSDGGKDDAASLSDKHSYLKNMENSVKIRMEDYIKSLKKSSGFRGRDARENAAADELLYAMLNVVTSVPPNQIDSVLNWIKSSREYDLLTKSPAWGKIESSLRATAAKGMQFTYGAAGENAADTKVMALKGAKNFAWSLMTAPDIYRPQGTNTAAQSHQSYTRLNVISEAAFRAGASAYGDENVGQYSAGTLRMTDAQLKALEEKYYKTHPNAPKRTHSLSIADGGILIRGGLAKDLETATRGEYREDVSEEDLAHYAKQAEKTVRERYDRSGKKYDSWWENEKKNPNSAFVQEWKKETAAAYMADHHRNHSGDQTIIKNPTGDGFQVYDPSETLGFSSGDRIVSTEGTRGTGIVVDDEDFWRFALKEMGIDPNANIQAISEDKGFDIRNFHNAFGGALKFFLAECQQRGIDPIAALEKMGDEGKALAKVLKSDGAGGYVVGDYYATEQGMTDDQINERRLNLLKSLDLANRTFMSKDPNKLANVRFTGEGYGINWSTYLYGKYDSKEGAVSMTSAIDPVKRNVALSAARGKISSSEASAISDKLATDLSPDAKTLQEYERASAEAKDALRLTTGSSDVSFVPPQHVIKAGFGQGYGIDLSSVEKRERDEAGNVINEEHTFRAKVAQAKKKYAADHGISEDEVYVAIEGAPSVGYRKFDDGQERAIVGDDLYLSRTFGEEGGDYYEGDVENLIDRMREERNAVSDEDKKRAHDRTVAAGTTVLSRMVDDIENKEGTTYKRTFREHTPNTSYDTIGGFNIYDILSEADYQKADAMGRFKSDLASGGVAISKEEAEKWLKDTDIKQLRAFAEDFYTADELKSLDKTGKGLTKKDYVEAIMKAVTLGTQENTNYIERMAKEGKETHGLISILGRLPYISGVDADTISDVFVDLGLKEGHAKIGNALALKQNADFDGDKVAQKVLTSLSEDEYNTFIKMGIDQKDIFRTIGRRLRAEADDSKLSHTYRDEKIYNSEADMIAGIAAKMNKSKLGAFSNVSENIRNRLRLSGMDELALANNPDDFEAQKKAASGMITRSLFQALEQDAISSKKVINRIIAKHAAANNRSVDSYSVDDQGQIMADIVNEIELLYKDLSEGRLGANDFIGKLQHMGVLGDDDNLISSAMAQFYIEYIKRFSHGDDVLASIFGQDNVDAIKKNGTISKGGLLAAMDFASNGENADKMVRAATWKGLRINGEKVNPHKISFEDDPSALTTLLEKQADAVNLTATAFENLNKARGGTIDSLKKDIDLENRKIGIALSEGRAIKGLGTSYGELADVIMRVAAGERSYGVNQFGEEWTKPGREHTTHRASVMVGSQFKKSSREDTSGKIFRGAVDLLATAQDPKEEAEKEQERKKVSGYSDEELAKYYDFDDTESFKRAREAARGLKTGTMSHGIADFLSKVHTEAGASYNAQMLWSAEAQKAGVTGETEAQRLLSLAQLSDKAVNGLSGTMQALVDVVKKHAGSLQDVTDDYYKYLDVTESNQTEPNQTELGRRDYLKYDSFYRGEQGYNAMMADLARKQEGKIVSTEAPIETTENGVKLVGVFDAITSYKEQYQRPAGDIGENKIWEVVDYKNQNGAPTAENIVQQGMYIGYLQDLQKQLRDAVTTKGANGKPVIDDAAFEKFYNEVYLKQQGYRDKVGAATFTREQLRELFDVDQIRAKIIANTDYGETRSYRIDQLPPSMLAQVYRGTTPLSEEQERYIENTLASSYTVLKKESDKHKDRRHAAGVFTSEEKQAQEKQDKLALDDSKEALARLKALSPELLSLSKDITVHVLPAIKRVMELNKKEQTTGALTDIEKAERKAKQIQIDDFKASYRAAQRNEQSYEGALAPEDREKWKQIKASREAAIGRFRRGEDWKDIEKEYKEKYKIEDSEQNKAFREAIGALAEILKLEKERIKIERYNEEYKGKTEAQIEADYGPGGLARAARWQSIDTRIRVLSGNIDVAKGNLDDSQKAEINRRRAENDETLSLMRAGYAEKDAETVAKRKSREELAKQKEEEKAAQKVSSEAQRNLNDLLSQELKLRKEIAALTNQNLILELRGGDQAREQIMYNEQLLYNKQQQLQYNKEQQRQQAALLTEGDARKYQDRRVSSNNAFEKYAVEMGFSQDSKEAIYLAKSYNQNLKERLRLEEQIQSTQHDMNIAITSREKEALYDALQIMKQQLNVLIEEGNQLRTNSRLRGSDIKAIEENYRKNKDLMMARVANKDHGARNVWEMMGYDIKRSFSRVFDYGIALRAMNQLQMKMREVVQITIQLDKAMTNLRIATGKSADSSKDLLMQYTKMAQQLGVTTEAVANSSIEWLRQGFTVQETNDLIQASTYLSKLGMIDASEATGYLTSAIKGFKLEATEAMDVVDKLTALDLDYAVSAGGIAEALSRTSVSAQLAGMSLDEIASAITVVGEVTQKSMNSIGESFKTLLSRYGNVKAGAFESLMDSEESTENINDIERVLKSLGIQVRSSSTEFRDFTDVLDEVADKWASLSTVEKNAVSTALGGTRQRENINALLENYDKYQEAIETSENSQGNALRKYDAYSESLEAHIASMTATWEEFIQTLSASPVFKGLVDFATFMIKALKFIIPQVLTLLVALNQYKMPAFFKYLPTLLGITKRRQGPTAGMESIWTATGQRQRAAMQLQKYEEGGLFETKASQRHRESMSIWNRISDGINNVIRAIRDSWKPNGTHPQSRVGAERAQPDDYATRADNLAERARQPKEHEQAGGEQVGERQYGKRGGRQNGRATTPPSSSTGSSAATAETAVTPPVTQNAAKKKNTPRNTSAYHTGRHAERHTAEQLEGVGSHEWIMERRGKGREPGIYGVTQSGKKTKEEILTRKDKDKARRSGYKQWTKKAEELGKEYDKKHASERASMSTYEYARKKANWINEQVALSGEYGEGPKGLDTRVYVRAGKDGNLIYGEYYDKKPSAQGPQKPPPPKPGNYKERPDMVDPSSSWDKDDDYYQITTHSKQRVGRDAEGNAAFVSKTKTKDIRDLSIGALRKLANRTGAVSDEDLKKVQAELTRREIEIGGSNENSRTFFTELRRQLGYRRKNVRGDALQFEVDGKYYGKAGRFNSSYKKGTYYDEQGRVITPEDNPELYGKIQFQERAGGILQRGPIFEQRPIQTYTVNGEQYATDAKTGQVINSKGETVTDEATLTALQPRLTGNTSYMRAGGATYVNSNGQFYDMSGNLVAPGIANSLASTQEARRKVAGYTPMRYEGQTYYRDAEGAFVDSLGTKIEDENILQALDFASRKKKDRAYNLDGEDYVYDEGEEGEEGYYTDSYGKKLEDKEKISALDKKRSSEDRRFFDYHGQKLSYDLEKDKYFDMDDQEIADEDMLSSIKKERLDRALGAKGAKIHKYQGESYVKDAETGTFLNTKSGQVMTDKVGQQQLGKSMMNTKVGGAMAVGAQAVTGAAAGIASAAMEGGDVAGAAIEGGATAVGAVAGSFFGPLGTMIGSVLGQTLGKFINWLRGMEERARKERSEEGKKQLEALQKIDDTLQEANSVARKDYEDMTPEDFSALSEFQRAGRTSLKKNSSMLPYFEEELAEAGIQVSTAAEALNLLTTNSEQAADVLAAFTVAQKKAEVNAQIQSEEQTRWELRDEAKVISAGNLRKLQKKGIIDLSKSEEEVRADLSAAVADGSIDEIMGGNWEKDVSTYLSSLGQLDELNDNIDSMKLEIALASSGMQYASSEEISTMSLEGAIMRIAREWAAEGVKVFDGAGQLLDSARADIEGILRSDDAYASLFDDANVTLGDLMSGAAENMRTQIEEQMQKQGIERYSDLKELALSNDKSDIAKLQAIADSLHMSIDELRDEIYNVDSEKIYDFAHALGITQEAAESMFDALEGLSSADLIDGVDSLVERYEKLADIMDQIAGDGAVSMENLKTVLSDYSYLLYSKDESGNITGASQSNILSNIVKDLYGDYGMGEYQTAMTQAQLDELLGSSDFFALLRTQYGEDWQSLFEDALTDEDLANLNSSKATYDSVHKIFEEKGGDKAYQAVEDLVNEMMVQNEYYDQINEKLLEWNEKVIDIEVEGLQSVIEALDKVNEARERELELIKAKDKLEEAKEEKVAVYREGVGWTYEADQEKVKNAKDGLEDAERNKMQEDLQYQIDILEDQKDLLKTIAEEKETRELKEIFEAWSETTTGQLGDGQGSYLSQLLMVVSPEYAERKAKEAASQAYVNYEAGIDEEQGTAVYDVISSYEKLAEAEKKMNSMQRGSVGYSRAQEEYNAALKNYQAAVTTAKDYGLTGENLVEYSSEDKKTVAEEIASGQYDDGKAKAELEDILAPIVVVGVAKRKDENDNEYMDAVISETGDGIRVALVELANKKVEGPGDDDHFRDNYSEDMSKVWILPYNEAEEKYESVWLNANDENITYNDLFTDKVAPWSLIYETDHYNNIAFKGGDGAIYWGQAMNNDDERNTVESGGKDSGTTGQDNNKWHEISKGDLDDWDTTSVATESAYNKHATGTLDAEGGLSLINEEGIEGIITPSGTLTALPAHSGVVPADLTRNLYELGEIAPRLIQNLELNTKTGAASSGVVNSEDNSTNVQNLYATFEVNEDFDFDALMSQARSVVNQTRHNYK